MQFQSTSTQGTYVIELDQAAASSSFFDSFVARIVNNVQVKIKNIHVRYEDKQTVPSVRAETEL